MQGEGADGGVQEGEVVFGEVRALRGEFAADSVDDGVGEGFA